MIKLIGYELFLPAVAAAIYGKKKNDNQVTQKELIKIVAITFRDSMIRTMKDTKLYRTEIPIDIYEGVMHYELKPPEGFIIESIVDLNAHKIRIPKNSYDLTSIDLIGCPTLDINTAFFVEVSLSAKRINGPCEFDEEFVERHYDAILANMFSRLAAMPQQMWKSLGSVLPYERKYNDLVTTARRQALSGSSNIKLETKRLSANV